MRSILICIILASAQATLPFLASAQTVSTRGPYFIEDYYQPGDGDNWAPALQRAQEMWMIPATGNPTTDNRRYYTKTRTIVFGSTRDVYPFIGDADGYGVEITADMVAGSTCQTTTPRRGQPLEWVLVLDGSTLVWAPTVIVPAAP